MLLEPELRDRLDRLSMAAGNRVRSSYTGRHRSKHLGESLDFADYREYVPGDDYRRIDHQLWARLGQVLVRRFEAEEELTVTIILDATASMGMGGKFETARRVAAIVSYLALSSGDRVVPVVIAGDGGRPTTRGPIGRHRSAWPTIERWLESIDTAGTTPLAGAIRGVVGPVAGKGAVVVVSDLLDEGWERVLDGAGLGTGGVVAHVLAPDELEPAIVGDVRLVDVETGDEVEASTSPDMLDEYRDAVGSFVAGAAGRSRRVGLEHVLVQAGPGAGEEFLRQMAASGALR